MHLWNNTRFYSQIWTARHPNQNGDSSNLPLLESGCSSEQFENASGSKASSRRDMNFLDVRHLCKPNQPNAYSFPQRLQNNRLRAFQATWYTMMKTKMRRSASHV